jgi:KDO2-lipid IV(A) lauroyltransferase
VNSLLASSGSSCQTAAKPSSATSALPAPKRNLSIHQLAKASFRRTGANLISATHTARLSPEKIKSVIHIENPELLDQALAKGKGVVLMLAHMGNWELLSRLVHLFPKGSKTGAFYRPLNNEILNERILARRQADGTRMFSKRDPFHQVTSFLREGGIVGILADQRVGRQGDLVSFFGRITRASPLPSLLSRRTKSEILALSMETINPGKWKIRFHHVMRPVNTEHCMKALEHAMSTSMTDVFWLQERWKIYIGKKKTICNWLGDHPNGDKPHRILLWLNSSTELTKTPKLWIHSDVIYEVIAPPGTAIPIGLPENTPMHPMPSHSNSNEMQATIAKIDQLQTLPIDLILCDHSSVSLTDACNTELIRIAYLHSSHFNLPPSGTN